MATRALINVPDTSRVGDVLDIRLLIQHPMETGLRVATEGQLLPRNLLRRVEARFEGDLVFAADLHAAVAANPYLAFRLRATQSGTLSVTWSGDKDFKHSQSVKLVVT